jgi:hypothetical protein
MSIADKVAFVAEVSGKLQPDQLKTSDGKHPYSEENILSVTLGVLVADNKEEFERDNGILWRRLSIGTTKRSLSRSGRHSSQGLAKRNSTAVPYD